MFRDIQGRVWNSDDKVESGIFISDHRVCEESENNVSGLSLLKGNGAFCRWSTAASYAEKRSQLLPTRLHRLIPFDITSQRGRKVIQKIKAVRASLEWNLLFVEDCFG